MKRKNNISIITALVFVAVLITCDTAQAAYALGSKTRSSPARKAQSFTQTCTGLTAKQDCFAAHQVSGYSSWVVYIKNTGAAALTDLDILVHYENANWDDAAINLTDAQPFSTDWNTGCVTNLATDTVCAVGLGAAEPVGWIKVQASAGSATSVDVTFIGRMD